jgi:hypothetical protein
VSPKYVARGSSKAPFIADCAMACVVVTPKANAVSAKVIVKCLNMFIVFLLYVWSTPWLPSPGKAQRLCKNCNDGEKYFRCWKSLLWTPAEPK